MWFDQSGEFFELFKNGFPFTFLVFLPLLIIISPVCPVNGSHDFPVFRMQQFDLQGTSYGCKASVVNMEARTLKAKMLLRRAVLLSLHDADGEKCWELIRQNVGAIIIFLPGNLSQISEEDSQKLSKLEKDLIKEEIPVPLYFTYEEHVNGIFNEIEKSSSGDQASTALEALMTGALANGYQLIANGAANKANPDFLLTNIQGKLSGYGVEEQLPTIIVVAHYDAYGIAPSLATGADSNASGVVILLELVRLFSNLYSNSRTHARFNLLFLLSAAGKMNFHGSKKWIEDNLDNTEQSFLSDVSYVICFDSIGSSDAIKVHVSKPPKNDSAAGQFFMNMEDIIRRSYPNVSFSVIHKRINLAEDALAWEHERYSMKRLQAFTVSRHADHRSESRATILDTRSTVREDVLRRNARIIAESLACHIYNTSADIISQLFNDELKIRDDIMTSWLDYLTSVPRAGQLLHKDHLLLSTLTTAFQRYLKDVKAVPFRADKRDPEFMFYSGSQFVMTAYNVKHAVFDLILAVFIAIYLGFLFLVIQNFSKILELSRRLLCQIKVKSS